MQYNILSPNTDHTREHGGTRLQAVVRALFSSLTSSLTSPRTTFGPHGTFLGDTRWSIPPLVRQRHDYL